MKAVIYARYSSSNQREESIEGQIRECQAFALKNDYIVVNEYVDRAISGTTDKRPGFQALIADSAKGQFEVVITYTIDRFARNRYDSAIYKAALKKNGVKIVYAKQQISDDPEGIILESVLEGYAEYYSKNLARNIKRGQRENALKAIPMGSPPLGYKTGPNRQYEIEPIGARIVTEIFDQYANGIPISKILKYLNDSGYKTAKGNAFKTNSIDRILVNKKYAGVYSYLDIEIEGAVPSIISKDLFERVQKMIKLNYTRRARAKAGEEYILTGKVFCGHCGKRLVGESGTGKLGTKYHYYICSSKKRNHDCNKKTEKKDWLEKAIVEYTVKHVLTDENISAIAKIVMKLYIKQIEDNSVLLALKAELKEINKRLDNVMNAIEQGIVTTTTRTRLEELENTKREIEYKITNEKMQAPLLTENNIRYWLNSFKNGNIDDEQYRRRVIETLVNAVYVYDDDDNNGVKMEIVFNTSTNNTGVIKRSDLKRTAPL